MSDIGTVAEGAAIMCILGILQKLKKTNKHLLLLSVVLLNNSFVWSYSTGKSLTLSSLSIYLGRFPQFGG